MADGYRPQSEDVSEEMDRRVFEGFATMTPQQKADLVAAASRALREMVMAGLRARHPEASDEEIFRRAGARFLGREFTRRMYGPEAEAWLED